MSVTTRTVKSLDPIGDKILVKDMIFGERLTSGGILLPGDDRTSRGIRPRWAEVHAVGPSQHDVKVGEWILVKHGRWTRGMKYEIDGVAMVIQMVDNNDILFISTVPQVDDTWSDAVCPTSDLHRIEGSMHRHDGREDF